MATPLTWGMKLPDGTPLKWGTPCLKWNGTLEEVLAANASQQTTTMNNKISATLNDTDKAAALALGMR